MGASPFNLVPGVEFYGELPEFVVEDLEVDKLGVLNAAIRIPRAFPLQADWLLPWKAPVFFPGVPCSKIRVGLHDRDGMCNLTYHFEGVLGGGDFSFPGDQAQLEVDCQTSPQSIQLHPGFSNIGRKYEAQYDDAKKTIFTGFALKCPKALLGEVKPNPDDPDGPRNPLYGTTDYQFPRIIFRRTWLAATLPPTLLDGVGFIDDSIIGGVAGTGQQPPRLKGRANWLNANVRGTYRGNTWQLTNEWWASDENGWNVDIYKRTI